MKNLFVVLVLSLGFAACGDTEGEDTGTNDSDMGGDVSTDMLTQQGGLEAEFAQLTMSVGATLRVPVSMDGEELDAGDITWTSSSASVGIEGGLWTAAEVGTAEVTAEYQDRSFTFTVEVVPAKYAQVAANLRTLCVLTPEGIAKCNGAAVEDGGAGLESFEFTKIAVEGQSACGLTADGQVRCWGLTDTRYIHSLNPARLEFPERVTDISAGIEHVCALLESGAVHCWGDGDYWQIGFTIPDEPYVQGRVEGPFVGLSASAFSTCAYRGDGYRACWGSNSSNIISNSADPVLVPTFVNDGLGDVQFGVHNACGLNEANEVHCWGHGATGVSKLGEVTDPSRATMVIDDVRSLAVANETACAVTFSGALYCWGISYDHAIPLELLNDDYPRTEVPQQVPGMWQSVVLSRFYGCGLDISGELQCWGYDHGGALTGRDYHSPEPRSLSFMEGVDDIAVSQNSICVIRQNELICKGPTRLGNTGTGAGPFPDPVSILAPPIAIAGVDLVSHAGGCAFTEDGQFYAWGQNYFGEIDPNRPNATTYEAVPINLPGKVIDVSCAEWHSCALLEGNDLYCWGANFEGQTEPLTMRDMVGITHIEFGDNGDPAEVVDVTARKWSTCAFTTKGNTYCWGIGLWGETFARRYYPVEVPGAVQMHGGLANTCVVDDQNGLHCWGSVSRLGSDLVPDRQATNAIQVAVTTNGPCYITTTKEVACFGELRNTVAPSTANLDAVPVTVPGVQNVKKLVAGWRTVCAIDEDDNAVCWGEDELGLYSVEESLWIELGEVSF